VQTRYVRLILSLGLALLPVARASAQKHPNIELGFKAERVYAVGDVDSVNLLNGNLIAHIPLGSGFATDGQFKYQLTLVYNGKVWDYVRSKDPLQTDSPWYTSAHPNWRSNAGVGWRLSLGRLIGRSNSTSNSAAYIYEGPSGAEHTFLGSSGLPGSTEDQYLYTHDQSRLRLKRLDASTREVQFPNGDVHTFRVECGDWRLREMRDAFGNFLQIAGNCDATGTRETAWTLTDSFERTHSVNFTHFAVTKDSADKGQHVSSVVLAADGGHQTYQFRYNADASVPWGCDHYVPDRWNIPPTATLPLLEAIVLPDGTSYDFTYYDTANTSGGGCSQGALARMTLPVGGQIAYTYQLIALPEDGCMPPQYATRNPAVRSRTTPDGRWDYVPTLSEEYAVDKLAAAKYCMSEGPAELAASEMRTPGVQPLHRWSRMTVLSPPAAYEGAPRKADGTPAELRRVRTDNFFYTWPERDRFPPETDPWNPEMPFETKLIRYGQAITTGVPDAAHANVLGPVTTSISDTRPVESSTANAHYVSTRMFEGCADEAETSVTGDCTNGRLLRTAFLRYHPARNTVMGPVWSYPPESSRTVFDDDLGCANAKCWTQTTNSEPDQKGHFLRSATSTNFPGGGGFSTYTRYVAAAPVCWFGVNVTARVEHYADEAMPAVRV
jgi:hypothetical protein